jgi:DNA polymerase-1
MAKRFFIIDGHAHIYRAYYAPFRPLTSPTGEPTKGTHVFCQMLLGLIQQQRPDYLAMVMDVSDRTVFRCAIDPQYKAHREPPPEDLDVQKDRIVSVVQRIGVPIHRREGFEADDLMATIVRRLRDRDIEIFLVSSDKDLEQLLSDRVRMFDPGKGETLDPAGLVEKKGYAPEQAVEIQTLAGDTTDNVPGVPGVGVKTAAKLIGKYGSAAAVLAHADELTPKLAESMRAFAGQMPITRQLVTLRGDVEFDFDLDSCGVGRFDFAAPRDIFKELGFTRLLATLDAVAQERGGAPPAAAGGQREGKPARAKARAVESGGLLYDAVPADDDVAVAGTPESMPSAAELTVPRGEYRLINTTALLKDVCKTLRRRKVIAFDTETTGTNAVAADLVGVSLCWEAGRAVYIPVRGLGGPVLPRDEVVAALRPFLEDPKLGKVGHHIKYDMLVMRQCDVRVRGVLFDTMVADFLLEPTRNSYSLDQLTALHCGHEMIPITDLIGKGRDQITMAEVDIHRSTEYAAEDADFTWRLYEVLAPRIRGSHVERLFTDTEMPLVSVLAEMEHNGVAIDAGLLRRLSGELSRRLEELTRQVHKAAGHPFNLDSTRQLATVLFDELGLRVIRKTKTGRSTDAETLETLVAGGDHPIPRLVLEYREMVKLKGTYLDTLPRMVCAKTGRIHASFHQTGAITGRLSSSDPNLQNIPIRTPTGREIRKAFVAQEKESVLLSADYSQIELRLLAHFCRDAALVEAFRTGQDIHATVAAQVNGIAISEVSPEQRSAAKAVNFGIIYGQTAFGLSRTLGIPVGEAQAFIHAYFLRYPGIRRFIDQCIADARRTGYAETILGRRRPIHELHSRNRQQVSFGERIAVNTVVQGSAADLIKRAMIDIHEIISAGELPARMLLQVHDELVFETRRAEAERVAAVVRGKMESAIALDVPIVVDVSWGRSWAKEK